MHCLPLRIVYRLRASIRDVSRWDKNKIAESYNSYSNERKKKNKTKKLFQQQFDTFSVRTRKNHYAVAAFYFL